MPVELVNPLLLAMLVVHGCFCELGADVDPAFSPAVDDESVRLECSEDVFVQAEMPRLGEPPVLCCLLLCSESQSELIFATWHG